MLNLGDTMDAPHRDQRVVVTDVQIPFTSMVVLLVKWALAAIPALIILGVIGFSATMIMAGIFGGMHH